MTKLYGGYPHAILNALADPKEIERGACGLMNALDRVDIDPNPISSNAWRPAHSRGDLPPKEKDPGLPTGLAVSGILLNVALHPADQLVLRYLGDHRHGAIVRFADDILVLAQSERGLFDLMEAVWRGLAEDSTARLARAKTESNLHLNWVKIEPRSIRDIVTCFLKDQGWEECEQCRHLLLGGDSGRNCAPRRVVGCS